MAGSSGRGNSRRNQMWMAQGSDTRLDAFSKRRFSLFKKVIELCTLCAVQNALVVLSIGGKAFIFGPRGVDPLRYGLPNGGKPDFDATNPTEVEEETNLHQLIKEDTDELVKLKAKNIRTEQLKQKWMESLIQGKGLVDGPIDGLSFEEILILNAEMEEIEKKLKKRMKELSAEPAASTSTSSAGETNASLGGSTENDPSADVNEQ